MDWKTAEQTARFNRGKSQYVSMTSWALRWPVFQRITLVFFLSTFLLSLSQSVFNFFPLSCTGITWWKWRIFSSCAAPTQISSLLRSWSGCDTAYGRFARGREFINCMIEYEIVVVVNRFEICCISHYLIISFYIGISTCTMCRHRLLLIDLPEVTTPLMTVM